VNTRVLNFCNLKVRRWKDPAKTNLNRSGVIFVKVAPKAPFIAENVRPMNRCDFSGSSDAL
jgi:hypothetical protein